MLMSHVDQNFFYLVMDFLTGGDVYARIDRSGGTIGVDETRFYAACALDALDYLFHNGILYRDLKPENILINSKGYGVLCDFGFAKKSSETTYTMCGTPRYLAPEIVRQNGHNRGVDMWALGIFIWECLIGVSPVFPR